MNRRPSRLSVCTLLLASLLVACGGAEAVSPEPEELLGTQEARLCSGLSVTTLAISGASTYQGEMAASGSWAVSSGANAVRLEYYIDNTLYASEERLGASGTWYFSQAGVSCGTHTLLVKAYPMVVDSAGSRTTCWGVPKSISKSISEACPGGTWQHMSTESCYDLFMKSCYQVNLSPACPSAPQGKYCSTLGSSCWHVKSSTYAELYSCQ